MVKRTRLWVGFMAVVLMFMTLTGCSGDDDPEDGKREAAVEVGTAVGTFVGKVAGTQAFVAVVATPSEDGEDAGAVQIYVSDGRNLSEWFSGPISDGGFVATSDDGDAETEGELTSESVTGTVVLPGGETATYEATPPSGAAGLYELSVSSAGEVTGASAAGLAVKGEISLGQAGTGELRLVDGKRLELALSRKRADDLAHLRAGQVRLIVLSDGELRGAAKGQPSKGGDFKFFIRSS